jgi:hypothetical protein
MPVRKLMFTLTVKHVLNLSKYNKNGSPEAPHFTWVLLEDKKAWGRKGGVDGINFNWLLFTYVTVWVIFYLPHASWHPPDEFASTVVEAVRLYQGQITRFDAVWPPSTTAFKVNSSSFLVDDEFRPRENDVFTLKKKIGDSRTDETPWPHPSTSLFLALVKSNGRRIAAVTIHEW